MKIRYAIPAACLAACLASPSVNADVSPPAREAFALLLAGDSDAAKALLRKTLEGDAADASAWFEMARIHFYHVEFDEAEHAIARAAELDPENPRLHRFAGTIAGYNAVSKHHRPETRDQTPIEIKRAIRALERAVTLAPDDHEARLQLIAMYLNNAPADGGDRERGEAHVRVLEAVDEVAGTQARCALLASDAKCLRLWERVVAARPDDGAAHAGLAEACLHADELDRAARHVDTALGLDPSRRKLLLTMGRAFAMADMPDRAAGAFERYLALEPAPPAPLRATATFFLAMVAKKQGHEEQAETLMAEAKRIDPRGWTFFMEPPEEIFVAP